MYMLYIFITSINVYFFFPRWHIKRGVREEQLDESRCQVRDGTLIIANVQQSDAGNAFTDFSQTEVEFSKFLFSRNRHSLVVRGAAKLFKLFAPTSHGDRNKEAPRHSLIFTFATITTKSGTDGLGLRTQDWGLRCPTRCNDLCSIFDTIAKNWTRIMSNFRIFVFFYSAFSQRNALLGTP